MAVNTSKIFETEGRLKIATIVFSIVAMALMADAYGVFADNDKDKTYLAALIIGMIYSILSFVGAVMGFASAGMHRKVDAAFHGIVGLFLIVAWIVMVVAIAKHTIDFNDTPHLISTLYQDIYDKWILKVSLATVFGAIETILHLYLASILFKAV